MPHPRMDLFVARQPIFDRRTTVSAYELLFRAGPDNYFVETDGSYSTSRVLSSQCVVGSEGLTEGKPAFVNFTGESLVRDFAFVLPPQDLVVEILETVSPEPEVIEACRRLKHAGYRLALDDYAGAESAEPFLPLVDFVKVDMLTADDAAPELGRRLRRFGCRLLAEKVETQAVHRRALDSGFDLFQGFFFCRPTMVASRAIPGFRLNYLRLLHQLNQPGCTVAKLEAVIKQEASLTFRLLRRVNSAAYGFRTETQSLRHALVLLGEREIRACATVWTLAELGKDQPAALVVSATVRGRLCESLAPHARLEDRAQDLFLLGLFSMLEAIMLRPIEEVLSTLPLSTDLRAALLGTPNRLRFVLDAVVSYEQADWEGLRTAVQRLALDETRIPGCYLDALRWASSVFGQEPLPPKGF